MRVDPARVRVPQRVQEGRRRRHGLLPALRAQRGRRARVHAAAHVRGDRPAPFGAQALHRAARQPRRPHARRRRAGARRLPRAARSRVRRDARRSAAPARVRPGASRHRRPRRRRIDTGGRRATARADRRRARRPFPDGFAPHPKLQRIIGNRRKEFDERPASTGRSPRRSRSARCCSKAHPCASPARTRGAARSASATRCSSTTRPRPSTRRSRTSAPTPRRS